MLLSQQAVEMNRVFWTVLCVAILIAITVLQLQSAAPRQTTLRVTSTDAEVQTLVSGYVHDSGGSVLLDLSDRTTPCELTVEETALDVAVSAVTESAIQLEVEIKHGVRVETSGRAVGKHVEASISGPELSIASSKGADRATAG